MCSGESLAQGSLQKQHGVFFCNRRPKNHPFKIRRAMAHLALEGNRGPSEAALD